MGATQVKASKKASSAVLTDEEIQLLLRNTHFDQKQIEEWHAGFIVNKQFMMMLSLHLFTHSIL